MSKPLINNSQFLAVDYAEIERRVIARLSKKCEEYGLPQPEIVHGSILFRELTPEESELLHKLCNETWLAFSSDISSTLSKIKQLSSGSESGRVEKGGTE